MSREHLAKFGKRVRLLQLDVLSQLAQLKTLAPFKLIYCRWLLVHLPKEQLPQVLETLISLLDKDGCLFFDECDNRSVLFRPTKEIETSLTSAQKATQSWAQISQALMRTLGNDLELTPEKLSNLLLQASHDCGTIQIVGHYQVTLQGTDQKRLIVDGYRSSTDTLRKACNKSESELEAMLAPFDECAKDDNIEVPFLAQNIVVFHKTPK